MELDRIAQRQHGLVTLSQLRGLGFDRKAVSRLVAAGRLLPVRLGVYRLCGVAPTWHSAALAALLAAGVGAVLSHRSAALLWGLLDADQAGQAGQGIELTSPRQVRMDGVTGHRHVLDRREVTTHRLIPVTTVERTLLDLAASTDAGGLGALLDDALRRRLTTPKRVLVAVRAHDGAGRRRLQPLKEALVDRGVGYDPGANDWEQAMDRMWDRLGLPPSERQYRIRVAGGRSFRPDRAILDARIAVDWNGYGAHGTRSAFDHDSDRRALLAAAGWYPLDFTSRSGPRLICRTVLAVYRERMGLLPAADGPSTR